jgi:hypothetical protein
VADNRSIEERVAHRLGRSVRRMGPNERLAGIGGIVVTGSLLLPWYGAPIASDLVKTGIGAFSFATAAMLLTIGAALFLVLEVGDGYRPPRPLTVGALLIAAGVWTSLIIVYQMAVRPQFSFAGLINDDYNVRYGMFVALGGAGAIVLAGVRRRVHEAAGHAAHADDHLDDLDDLGDDDDD